MPPYTRGASLSLSLGLYVYLIIRAAAAGVDTHKTAEGPPLAGADNLPVKHISALTSVLLSPHEDGLYLYLSIWAAAAGPHKPAAGFPLAAEAGNPPVEAGTEADNPPAGADNPLAGADSLPVEGGTRTLAAGGDTPAGRA